MRTSWLLTTLVAGCATSALAVPVTDPMASPFRYFNVYSIVDIGSSTHMYGSDFQGIAGAGGNVYFTGFSLGGYDPVSPYVLHTGGSATISGSYLGNLDVGTNVSLGSVNVNGHIRSGGSVSNFGGGSVYGNVTATGNVTLSNDLTVTGTRTSGAPFSSPVNHAQLATYFRTASAGINTLAPTGTYMNSYGGLSITGSSGVNIINIDASVLNSAWGFAINAPKDAIIHLNVLDPDHIASLDSTDWTYTGGVTASNVLLNFAQTTSLNLSGGNTVNILAPFADVTFSSGLVTGNLITGSLIGSGQVNVGHFLGNPVPEPLTLALTGLGTLSLLAMRRRSCNRN